MDAADPRLGGEMQLEVEMEMRHAPFDMKG
jgi:hypothetical protein